MPTRARGCCLYVIAIALLCMAGQFSTADAEDKAEVGATRVAKWKDDRTAVFLLMFDDSWPSHFQVAAPELEKRGMTGTFYICPGKGEYEKFAKEWEEKLWKQGMVYGNHTLTHKGVKDAADADWEIGECARIIRKITPGKPDRLVSFALPGVKEGAWNLSKEGLAELLKKHNLIDRPPFNDHGAVYHWKTSEEMLKLADKAIANQGMEYLVIHGLERIKPDWGYQDFWPLKQEIFFNVLDGLQQRREKGDLWITDHISQHQYETERSTAAVKVLSTDAAAIRLELTTQADPKFYDLPLTLISRVPATWKLARVSQGDKASDVRVEESAIKFDALPGGGVIELREAKDK
ncbi:polysaccharide deacetylase family protein [Anatilimnocola floriformis]|uniref:polysaccharide deacetylase family protein n=1 Tax=Anatilimnocola floriformis TaxID=2948575 RepID=UPI0020C46470|nr:polysaccharide deacetylase family protein [Anatilimnocola floriformis]